MRERERKNVREGSSKKKIIINKRENDKSAETFLIMNVTTFINVLFLYRRESNEKKVNVWRVL